MATRRNLDETRQRILDAGAAMMSDAGYSLTRADITLIDACRRAGLGTAGSGYKIWGTQDEFRDELIRHVLAIEGDRNEPGERVIGAVAELGESPNLADIIRVASTENVDAVVGSEWFTRLIALWLAASNDDDLRAAQVETQRKLLRSLEDTFGGLLDGYGREMRPPFTLEMLTLAICAEMNGLGYFGAYDDNDAETDISRPTGPEGELQQWHLLGCVIEALVEAFTRPVDGPPTAPS